MNFLKDFRTETRALLIAVGVLLVLAGGMILLLRTQGSEHVSLQQENTETIENSEQEIQPLEEIDQSILEELRDCLELQSWHTHEVFPIDGFNGGPNLGLPAPQYKINPCEERAWTTTNPEEMRLLSQSRDPVVLIYLAANVNLSADLQRMLYERRENLPNSWDKLLPVTYKRDTPQKELVQQLVVNENLDPEIVRDVVDRFMAKDSIVDAIHVSTLIENPAATVVLDEIAQLNILDFNRKIAAQQILAKN
ncbi:MAG TPA: hypothetical protein VGA53_03875 [Candidatus Paceibacterota bacterium]